MISKNEAAVKRAMASVLANDLRRMLLEYKPGSVPVYSPKIILLIQQLYRQAAALEATLCYLSEILSENTSL